MDAYDSIASFYNQPTPAPAGGGDVYDSIAAHYNQPAQASDTGTPTQAASWLDMIKELGRQGALTGRYAAEGITGLFDPVNAALGLQPASKATGDILTSLGVPQPQTPTERVVGDVSRGLVGAGGSLAAWPTQLLGAIPEALTYLTSAGAGSGAAGTAREAGFGPGMQAAAGLAGGFATPALGAAAEQSLLALGRGGKAYAAPFTQAGQQKAVGNILNKFATNPQEAADALGNVKSYVEGSLPTTGMASADPGLLGLENALRNEPGVGPQFVQQAAESNAARLAALGKVSGTDATLKAAQADRAATAQADYGAAMAATPELTPKDSRALTALMDRPAFATAWKAAESDAANFGLKPQDINLENPQFLDLLKKQLDTQAFWNPSTAAEKASMLGVQNVRSKFLDVLDNINPQYAIARGNFAAASAPINQMEALQNLGTKAQIAAPDVLGNPVLSQAKWKQNAGTPETLGDLAKVLTPEQMQVVQNIGQDLNRASLPGSVKAIGSNTVQNLAMGNALHQAFGGAGSNPLVKALSYPLTLPYKYSGIEGNIDDLLTQAALNPALASRLMQQVPFQMRQQLAQLLSRKAQAATLGSIASTGQTVAAGQ